MQSSHWFFSCSQKAQRPVQLHKPKGMLQYLANTLFDQLHSVQPEDWLLCPLSEPQDSQGCFGTYTAAHRNTLSRERSSLSNNQALSSVPILRFFFMLLGSASSFSSSTMSSQASNINKLDPIFSTNLLHSFHSDTRKFESWAKVEHGVSKSANCFCHSCIDQALLA